MNISAFWIYPTTQPEITSNLILRSIALLEPQKDRFDLSRDNTPDDSWKSHLEELKEEEQGGGWYFISADDVILPKEKVANVPQFYVDINLPLTVDLAGSQSRRQLKIIEELEKLDPQIRRDFWASNCAFIFGYHDIYQHASDVRAPEFIARPSVSFRFWDYSFVKRDEFLSPFADLPTVITLLSDLEKLWGPVATAVTTYHS